MQRPKPTPQAFSRVDELLRSADAALRQRRFVEAESICLQALDLEPASPKVQYMLAVAASGTGKSAMAAEILRGTVRQVPHALEPSFELANLLRKDGQTTEAISVCETFLARTPNAAVMHSLVGICYGVKREYPQAVRSFRRAIELEPANVRFLGHLAGALRLDGAKEEAARILREALSIDGRRADLFVSLGETLAELGRFEEAGAEFEQALRLQPHNAWAFLGVATSRKLTEQDAAFFEAISGLIQEPALPSSERCTLHYALAKALDDVGKYEEALANVDEAVRITVANPQANKTSFDALDREAAATRTIETFTREFFHDREALGLESDLPVLIVGAPRSGTTLLDQILTSHPEIGRAGELLYWIDHFEEADDAVKARNPGASEIAARYLELLRRCAPDKPRVVDKMPMNYAALGLIHALMPKARIIHCRRHPVDTCLSLYLNGHIISPKPYGETREQIVAGYKQYLRVMEHWRSTLPPEVFQEVEYEDLVADREPILRRLIEFLGLEWDDACLRHESNTSQVSTPSRWQARQPLYGTSVERWRRYEPWLGAFRELLRPEDQGAVSSNATQ